VTAVPTTARSGRLQPLRQAGSLALAAVTAPGRAASHVVGRGVRRVRSRSRQDLVIDDEQALAAAETGVRRRGSRRVEPEAPAEPPPPRLRPRTVALVAVALAVPVGAAGVAVLTHDRLALREVTVSGTGLLAVEDVRAAVGVAAGTPLAVVDLDRVAESVEALPEVADADVERRWPSRVHVTVTERTPVTAVADGSGAFVLVDSTGTPFRTVPAPPAAVPLLDVAAPQPGDPATADGLTVIQALPPALLAQVERVEVPEPGSVTFALRDGGRVVWGGAERSESKAVVLQALLPREAEEYDVTAPEVAVTRR
jgi:cell division protein FtsQ